MSFVDFYPTKEHTFKVSFVEDNFRETAIHLNFENIELLMKFFKKITHTLSYSNASDLFTYTLSKRSFPVKFTFRSASIFLRLIFPLLPDISAEFANIPGIKVRRSAIRSGSSLKRLTSLECRSGRSSMS